MKQKIKICIVDDHPILLQGLRLLIDSMDFAYVCCEASSGEEFLEVINKDLPDIVIMDIAMSGMDGIEASRIAIKKHPKLKILTLSMLCDHYNFERMINAGIHGFILKNSNHHELKKAIECVAAGGIYFHEKQFLGLIKKNRRQEKSFTEREKTILTLLCQGCTNYEIADAIHLSLRTVEKYRSELIQKTGTLNCSALAVYAIKNNLINIGGYFVAQ